MSDQTPNLSDLRVSKLQVPAPGSRWLTRIVLPVAILLIALGLLAYSARDLLRPALEVRTTPIVIVSGGAATGAGRAGSVVQGPGIVEPRPYAISVPALQEGVISEVLKLEGDRVEAGEVVARMIDADARIAVARAEAEIESKRRMITLAEARKSATVARVNESSVELARMRRMFEAGGATEGELAQAEAKYEAMRREIDEADAEIQVAHAEVAAAQAMLREAALMLERTEIRSPAAGTVMARGAEPGMRIMTTIGAEGESDSVLRLYDPSNLFVIVDVPLADAAAVHQGLRAEVVTDALPDRVFKGTVALVVHEANTARNTVQFKIALEETDPVLKPGMLTRVRIFAEREAVGGDSPKPSERFAVPQTALVRRGDSVVIFLFDPIEDSMRGVARSRPVSIESETDDGFVTFVGGALPGERVIVDPPSNLAEGMNVKVIQESKEEATHEHD